MVELRLKTPLPHLAFPTSEVVELPQKILELPEKVRPLDVIGQQ